MPSNARALISGKGEEVVRQIGIDVIRGIVTDVLCGKNLRDSTEVITRKRLATINAATLAMLIKGEAQQKGFTERLPLLASEGLKQRPKGNERQILQWILGLTTKATQNVLRDDTSALDKYKDDYIKACQEVVSICESDYGGLNGSLILTAKEKAEINWNFVIELSQMVGAETLAIRGSEKSTYGKLFERLILGSLLSILDFKYIREGEMEEPKRVFWLSSTGEKRESDATLLYQAGKGVRFDIGFIGRGNPEISLDKVSRFERKIELGSKTWYLATIILVDTIGKGSKIQEQAKQINGTIIQMSMTYWPKQVAIELNKTTGFKHELIHMSDSVAKEYICSKMRDVLLQAFITKATE